MESGKEREREGMTSTFHGLEIGKRSLYTQQAALTTAGNNISNANTPGYSRQRVDMQVNFFHPLSLSNR